VYLKYGSYQFPTNGSKLSVSQDTLINAGGQPYASLRRIEVDGYLEGDGPAAIVQAASALKTALAKPYQDLIFYLDNGTESDTHLKNNGSTTGVVVKGPNFPDSLGGEYATFRRYTFMAEAEYPVTNTAGLLLSFRERLSFSGGGPIYRHKLALNGLPQKQMIYAATPYKVTQEGEAVGYTSPPRIPAPIWPAAMTEAPQTTNDSPERRGKLYTSYRTTWRYSFESAYPLVGAPTIWKG
jgi:hypothetical protein